jgi:hypothetical protein
MIQWILGVTNDFFFLVGILWTITEIVDYFFDNIIKINLQSGHTVYVIAILLTISLPVILIKNYPKRRIKRNIRNSRSTITILEGDISKSKNNICISSSNYFNTSLKIISSKSILGQIIQDDFAGNCLEIDKEISKSLVGKKYEINFVRDGNCKSYNIGTITYFTKKNGKKVILIALVKIIEKEGLNTYTPKKRNLVTGLEELWKFVRYNMDDEILSIPVLGTGLSKTTDNLIESILTIVLSYKESTMKNRVNRGIEIIVSKDALNLKQFDNLRRIITNIL